jgi:holo-[acyl-carrier protein] synthase
VTGVEGSAIDWSRLVETLRPGEVPPGVGVDLETVESLRRRRRDVRSLFTVGEREYCESRADPWESYTATWCAKEAVVKALSRTHRLSVREVEIRRSPSGRPSAFWANPQPRQDCDAIPVEISIAHTPEAAVAVAVAAPVTGPPSGP